MPAGVSMGEYLRFAVGALAFMFAGSQMVHYIYRPLKDMDDLVKAEVEKNKSQYTEDKSPSS